MKEKQAKKRKNLARYYDRDRARALKDKLHISFQAVINQALRLGLEKVEQPTKRRSYRTKPHAMGLRRGYNLDNVQELLASL